jgi:hypothetical protein
MAAILFLLAISLGGAALLFKEAAAQISVGTSWAGEVCSTSQMFCHHPEYLAYRLRADGGCDRDEAR